MESIKLISTTIILCINYRLSLYTSKALHDINRKFIGLGVAYQTE